MDTLALSDGLGRQYKRVSVPFLSKIRGTFFAECRLRAEVTATDATGVHTCDACAATSFLATRDALRVSCCEALLRKLSCFAVWLAWLR